MPTDEERAKICVAVVNKHKKGIKTNQFMATSFGVLAGISLFSIDCSTMKSTLTSLFLPALFLVFTVMSVWFKNISRRECDVYERGLFQVADGYASQIVSNTDKKGCVNLWFESDTLSDGWYRARYEGVEVGTKLLLVKPTVVLKNSPGYVFTPFMLSDVGSKLYW